MLPYVGMKHEAHLNCYDIERLLLFVRGGGGAGSPGAA